MDTDKSFKNTYSMVNLMETEKDVMKYATSINKALNNTEMPVKPKHLRSTIIGTFREQGAQTFWAIALKTPYLEDVIVAWKFCYVVHKILQEGHPLCSVHSQRHKQDLEEMGNLWNHLRSPYSRMIKLYCDLLMVKLDFHNKNPRFPGNLGVTEEELESIVSGDINNYFQLAVEMFDNLECILDLQTAIFGPIYVTEDAPEVLSGADQCLLAPIIPCLQDAFRLYDYSVKIMFKLHSGLPHDILSGHRQRFLKVFKELRLFYLRTNDFSYLRNLITVPTLPEEPPFFLSSPYAYVTQEVTLAEETKHQNESSSKPNVNDYYEASLVDITESNPHTSSNNSVHSDWTSSPSAPLYEEIYYSSEKNRTIQNSHYATETDESDKDRTIQNLQSEIEKLRTNFDTVIKENQKNALIMQDKILSLEAELAKKEDQLSQERQMRKLLETKGLTDQRGMGGDYNIQELYAKLQKDYIALMMKNGELQKQIRSLEVQLAEKENESAI